MYIEFQLRIANVYRYFVQLIYKLQIDNNFELKLSQFCSIFGKCGDHLIARYVSLDYVDNTCRYVERNDVQFESHASVYSWIAKFLAQARSLDKNLALRFRSADLAPRGA